MPLESSQDVSTSVRTSDPDEFTENVQPFAPGVRMSATAARNFRSHVRAWPLRRSAILSISVADGQAWFPANRAWATLTLPLIGSFTAGTGRRTERCAEGCAYLISPGHGGAAIRPDPGSHLLAITLNEVDFEAHEEALDARWGERPHTGDAFLRGSGAAWRRFLRHADWILRELIAGGSRLRVSHAAQEAEATLAQLLVEARYPEPRATSNAPSHASVFRAEEFLAASLEGPVSLADVARTAGVSTRTLSRAFSARHGVGPMVFLRRRRLEAARRDLSAAVPGEVSVTTVAMRYGFAHLGRFAVDFRRCFGESPSETLRG